MRQFQSIRTVMNHLAKSVSASAIEFRDPKRHVSLGHPATISRVRAEDRWKATLFSVVAVAFQIWIDKIPGKGTRGKFSPTKLNGNCEEIANPSSAYGRRRRNWIDAHGPVPDGQVVDAS